MTNYWFISSKNRQLSRLAFITFLFAFLVIMLGAYTRLTNAGLSCPDWPHCYGFITAPHTELQLQDAAKKFPLSPVDIKKAWTEMTHRYFAGAEGILILIFALSSLTNRQSNELKPIIINSILIALLGVQIMLGMLTVTEKLRPIIVLSHLLTGISILSVLWWAYLDSRPKSNFSLGRNSMPRNRLWFWVALVIIFCQIILGGWVSTHYAGLACVDFPYCNGELLPTLHWTNLSSDLITIHMLHRIGAFITGAYIITFALSLFMHASFRPISVLLITLITLQIILGILNIIWQRPVWLALVHQAVAITILLTVIASLVKAYHAWNYRHGF